MPKVSVIVPCYNMEKYIERCLNSLQRQLLEDIEIICVDDKSTDNTLNILKARAESDARIRIIEQERNMGVSVARNTAIDNATGEFIGFVDADDYVDIDFYQKIYNHAIRTDAEISKALFTIIENGRRWIPPTNEYAKVRKVYFCYDFQSAIYKRDFLNKNNLRFMEGLTLGEDTTFLIKASYLCNKLAICPYATSYYYQPQPSSACKNIDTNKVNSVIKAMKHIIEYANNIENMPKEDYRHFVWFALDTLTKNLSKTNFEDIPKLEKTIFDTLKQTKIKKQAEKMLCEIFGQQVSFTRNRYVPNKKILKLIKKHNKDIYDTYVNQTIFEKEKLSGLIKIVETHSFIKIKLFDTITIYSKYKGKKPLKTKSYDVNLADGMPKISIIVHFHNSEAHIGECIESLQKQTLTDIEIVCVDDCSTDSSREIVENFAKNDERIKIITNDKKSGIAYSRNIAIQRANAPYIMFCNADDTLKLDACEKMLHAIHQNNTDIAICSIEKKSDDSKEKKQEGHFFKLPNSGVFDMNKRTQTSCTTLAVAKLFKRNIIIDKEIEFPTNIKYEEEFFYPAYCIWARTVTWIDEALYIYRHKQESIMDATNRENQADLAPINIAALYLEYCKKHGVWYREKFWVWDVLFPAMFIMSLQKTDIRHRSECFICARKHIKKHYSAKGMPPVIQMKINDIRNGR